MASVQTNRRLGVFLQYTQMAINIIINLLFTPIMIKITGKNEYGIYSTVALKPKEKMLRYEMIEATVL